MRAINYEACFSDEASEHSRGTSPETSSTDHEGIVSMSGSASARTEELWRVEVARWILRTSPIVSPSSLRAWCHEE